jgi:signal peptidase I
LAEKTNKNGEEQKKKRAGWIDYAELILFAGLAILLVFGFNWILGLALHTDTPLVVVTSESMEPTYYGSNRTDHGGTNDIRKDMLIIRGVPTDSLVIGDVIVYNRINHTEEDIPIVHRIVNIIIDNVTGDRWFTTKGDNPNSNELFIADPKVDELNIHESRVVGKVIGRIPYLGGITSYFQTKTGRWILIITVGVIVIGTIFLMFRGEDEEEEENEDDEIFSTKIKKEKKKEEVKTEDPDSFVERFKAFSRKVGKQKHIVIPSVILAIIIFVPIVDTLAADYNAEFGVTNADYRKYQHYDLQDGSYYFSFFRVTISVPGHWHQKLESFTLSIKNTTSGDVVGSSAWSIVYNFEGTKTISTGAFIADSLFIDGGNYTITVTGTLNNKFGKTWYSIFDATFIMTNS